MLENDRRLDVFAVIALVLAAPAALADQWQFNPRVEVGAQSDTNYVLLPPPSAVPSVSGGFGNVLLELRDVGAATDFRFGPGVYTTYFPNNKDYQSTAPYAYLDVTHHGQTSTAKLWAEYANQSTVFSERLTSNVGVGGLGNPTGGDSGYLALFNRRQTIFVKPSYESEVSQLNHVTAELSYFNASYDKFIPNTFVAYRTLVGALGWVHDLTQRTSWTVRAVYSRFEPDGTTGSNKSAGLEAYWNERVSDTAHAYVRVAGQRTQFDQVPAGQASHATSYSGGAGMDWAFQVTQVYLDLTRTVQPVSSGNTVERNQLLGRVTRDLTPLLIGYVGGRAFKDSTLERGLTYSDRTYGVGTIGFEWRFSRAWTLAGQYNYSRQKFAIDAEAATSNAATLSFVYEPHRDSSKLRSFGRDRGY